MARTATVLGIPLTMLPYALIGVFVTFVAGYVYRGVKCDSLLDCIFAVMKESISVMWKIIKTAFNKLLDFIGL